jgi:predicted  nucleic acid-binding Zn-ribbon protein
MKADPASQRRLLEVQAVDTKIDHLEQRVQALPVHQRARELSAARQAAQDGLIIAKTALSDAEATRDKAEADVVPVKERLARNEKRVKDGSLDAKALTAMLDEIEHLKVRVSVMEDEELEAMQAQEDAEAGVKAAAAAADEAERQLQAVLAEREAALQEARLQMKGLRADREQAAAGLPEALMTLYERARGRYHGIGAAELVGRRCTGCGLEATTADYHAYLAAPPDEVLRCAECERLLIRAA